MSELWLSFIAALVRFWDNCFVHKEDPIVTFLKIELERTHSKERQFLDLLLSKDVKPITESDESETSNFQPIIRKPHWRVGARKLEAEARERAKQLKDEYEAFKSNQQPMTTEALEEHLNITAEN